MLISLAGISHMRIPLAYWYFQVESGEPFPQPVLDDNNPERFDLRFDYILKENNYLFFIFFKTYFDVS